MPGKYEDGLIVERYHPDDSDACMAIERASPQGKTWRLSFQRSTFHRRADNFAERYLIVGRMRDRVVAACGAAIKSVTLHGEPRRAAFYFDLRVHPDVRGGQIGRRMAGEAGFWGATRSDFGYTYVVDDNAAARAVMGFWKGRVMARYAYLVYPVFHDLPPPIPVTAVPWLDVHRGLLSAGPAFDFYADPTVGSGPETGLVGAWRTEDGAAGAAAWDNSAILGEVLEGMPRHLEVASRMSRRWPLSWPARPHLPLPGEPLRAWYVFDIHGPPPAVRSVIRRIAAEARIQGVHWLYLVHGPEDPWVEAVRADVPRVFAPIVPYVLIAGWPGRRIPEIRRPYIDIRDI